METVLQLLVRRRCRELGITLQEVVTRADLSRSHLYKLCDGTIADPSIRTLTRLARALEVPTIVLLRCYMAQDGHHHPPTTLVRSHHTPDDVVAFSTDTTIPDHSLVAPGETFKKTWAIQNLGQTTWRSRRFVRVDEELVVVRRIQQTLVPLLDAHLSSLGNSILIPDTLPGMPCEVSMEFKAPEENCSVASIWRMVSADNAWSFPPEFFLQVIVTVVGH